MKPLTAAFALAALALSQAAADEKTPGLAVGKPAPKFTLKDQNDKEHSLDDLLKKGKLVVVFHRSAEW